MFAEFIFENCRIKSDQIFEGLSREEHDFLFASSVTHIYKKGEILFREGGIPLGIFQVKSGLVKKYKLSPKGAEQIFYLSGAGELVGYHALLSEEHYPDSAATIESSEIVFIPKDAFQKVLGGSAALSNALLKALGHEFSLYLNHINNLTSKTVRERLAFYLLILGAKFEANAGDPPEIMISRQDLASIVGTAKETLVRLLHDFTELGLIAKTDRSVTVLDRTGVIKEANLRGAGQ